MRTVAIVLAWVALLAGCTRAQTVRVVDQGGRAVVGAKVRFLADWPRTDFELLIDLLLAQEPIGVERLPFGQRAVVLWTDARGEATPPPAGANRWSAIAIAGDLGGEVRLPDPKEPQADDATLLVLAPMRRVRVVGSDGRPVAGALVRCGALATGTMGVATPWAPGTWVSTTDAQGLARVVPVLDGRLANLPSGVVWAAPGPEPVFVAWEKDPRLETVMQLPPVARLEIEDAAWRKGECRRVYYAIESNFYGMAEGRLVLPHVPAATALEIKYRHPEAWINRVITPLPGETKILRLREPPRAARIRGAVVQVQGPMRLTRVAAYFPGGEDGEGGKGTIAPDGSFMFELESRRPAVGRDVSLFLAAGTGQDEWQFEVTRRRLGEPGEDGAIPVGTIRPVPVAPTITGMLTDANGGPVPDAELEITTLIGGDMELTVGSPRTDPGGRFAVTGSPWTDETAFITLKGGKRRIVPEYVVMPCLDLHLMLLDADPVEVALDATAARVDSREAVIVFEARPDDAAARGLDALVVRQTQPQFALFETWKAEMALAPGCWNFTARIEGSETPIAEAHRVEIRAGAHGKIPVAMPSTKAWRRVEVAVGGADGGPVRDAKLRVRRGSEWDEVRLGLDGTGAVDFTDSFADIVASAEGCVPAAARVVSGLVPVVLRPAARVPLLVLLAAFPDGVQTDVAWSVVARFARTLPDARAEPFPDVPREPVVKERVVPRTTIGFQLPEPGVWRLELVGGQLVYAVREVAVPADGRAAEVELAVDPDSPGMRVRGDGR